MALRKKRGEALKLHVIIELYKSFSGWHLLSLVFAVFEILRNLVSMKNF